MALELRKNISRYQNNKFHINRMSTTSTSQPIVSAQKQQESNPSDNSKIVTRTSRQPESGNIFMNMIRRLFNPSITPRFYNGKYYPYGLYWNRFGYHPNHRFETNRIDSWNRSWVNHNHWNNQWNGSQYDPFNKKNANSMITQIPKPVIPIPVKQNSFTFQRKTDPFYDPFARSRRFGSGASYSYPWNRYNG